MSFSYTAKILSVLWLPNRANSYLNSGQVDIFFEIAGRVHFMVILGTATMPPPAKNYITTNPEKLAALLEAARFKGEPVLLTTSIDLSKPDFVQPTPAYEFVPRIGIMEDQIISLKVFGYVFDKHP